MFRFYSHFALASFVVLIPNSAAVSYLRLQSGPNFEESQFSLQLEHNVPDLSVYLELNGTMSICFSGIWFFYTEPNYYGNTTYLTSYDLECKKLPVNGYPFDPSAGTIASVRFMGYQRYPWYNTATFFDGVDATGNGTMFDIGVVDLFEKINFNFTTLVLTYEFAQITLYQRADGQGWAKCFKSEQFTTLIYWGDLAKYGIERGDVGSIRKGCHTTAVPA